MDTDAADRILSRVQRQLWIVTAADGDRRGGLVATFVSRTSIVKRLPRVLAALAVGHHTTELVLRSGSFGAHLVTAAEREWIWSFGLTSGRAVDKLAAYRWHLGASGAPLLSDASACLDCRVESSMNTGDRIVLLAEVVAATSAKQIVPLTVDDLRSGAPAEKLALMDELFARDAENDASLIESFRAGSR